MRSLAALACPAILAWPIAAFPEALPQANKLVALVRSDGCTMAMIEGRMGKVGKAMVRDSATTRVIIDWPGEPARNLDMMGNPSPILAALEVSAQPPALMKLATKMERKLERACPADVYIVHERRLLTTPRSWQLGEASPEPKVITTLVRKQGLSLREFDAEWAGPHARLSLAWRKARGGNGHYVQNLVVGRIGGKAPLLDGIGEIEGVAGRPAGEQERLARAETADHARSFQDMEKTTMFTAREVILKD